MKIDIEDHGTIVLFRPLDDASREWLENNTNAEAWQWWAGALAVDHRAARELLEVLS